MWLCDGCWRYERRKSAQDEGEDNSTKADKETETANEDDDDMYVTEDDDDDENEYVDEDKVLQDGLAPYVLYGEWLYAKHSVHYTGLKSWFIPFDLYDIKTGTFVSRTVFLKAISQTQLSINPAICVPEDVHGDVGKTLQWVLEMLQSWSALMRKGEKDGGDHAPRDRVEGLYFRIDQGDRLMMRSKVVRPDFIAGEERWGAKEQVANQIGYYADYEDEDDENIEHRG